MLRRSLFLAAAFLAFGLGALEARAGSLPATGYSLAQIISGSPYSPFTVDGTGNPGGEVLTFSNFAYSVNPVGSPPSAADVTVLPFALAGPPAETGITFTGGFFAAPGTIVDYAIFYTVTAPAGEKINDAYLAFTGGNFGGNGLVGVDEKFTNPSTGALIGNLSANLGSNVVTTSFDGQQSIRVEKDIILVGGSAGATVSIINQGFSSTTIPEPTSMALLGIGMAGFFTYRRLFKRTATA